MGKNLGKIIFLNAVGLTIFFSWYLPAEHGFWFTLDKSIFYYFNEQLQPESSFTYFVGLTNVRHFDIISLMAMLALYGYYYSKQDHLGKRKMWFIGVTMLFFAVILNQLGHLIPVQRCSPTGFFENIHRVSKMLVFKTKDYSGDSFPGDHGSDADDLCRFHAEIFWQKSFCRQLHYFNNFYAAAYYGRSALVYRYCCRFFKYFFGWFELGFTDAGE